MNKYNDKLYVWASEIDTNTVLQAEKTARMDIIAGHVALMPDAHLGKGATIGSVIPTENAIIPSAVGVDIGCGMIATRTNLTANDLPDSLEGLMPHIEKAVPAGLGEWHATSTDAADRWYEKNQHSLTSKQASKALVQLGTLGSGNHFFEVCLDELDRVWVVMHSGSRGVGNELAQQHIKVAKEFAKENHIPLEDPELAYLQEKTPEFDAYIRDMLWAQDYAMENRRQMMDAAIARLLAFIGTGKIEETINCHHNFAQKEHHGEQDVWVTRKGAIQADTGRLGVIPGSMGTKSYIVRGLGNPDSFNSCSHGAGRRMSRGQARKTLNVESFAEAMGDKVWQKDKAQNLLDEHPDSYKDIDQVMADQKDLVEVVATLHQIFNYKGTS